MTDFGNEKARKVGNNILAAPYRKIENQLLGGSGLESDAGDDASLPQ